YQFTRLVRCQSTYFLFRKNIPERRVAGLLGKHFVQRYSRCNHIGDIPGLAAQKHWKLCAQMLVILELLEGIERQHQKKSLIVNFFYQGREAFASPWRLWLQLHYPLTVCHDLFVQRLEKLIPVLFIKASHVEKNKQATAQFIVISRPIEPLECLETQS